MEMSVANGQSGSQHVLMFPRRKAGVEHGDGAEVRPRRGRPPVAIDLAAVRTRFGLPQQKAAAELGISLTSLKQVCRKLGLERWPYRRGSRTVSLNASKRPSKAVTDQGVSRGASASRGHVQAHVAAPFDDRTVVLASTLRPFPLLAPIPQGPLTRAAVTADLSSQPSGLLSDTAFEAHTNTAARAYTGSPGNLPSTLAGDQLHNFVPQQVASIAVSSGRPAPSNLPSLHEVISSSANMTISPADAATNNAGAAGGGAKTESGISLLIAVADAHLCQLDSLRQSLSVRTDQAYQDQMRNNHESSCRASATQQQGHTPQPLLEKCPSAQAALHSLLLLQEVSVHAEFMVQG